MLRYLKRTTDYTLVYQYDSGEIHLEAWADSDYAGEIDTRKSTSRFCVKVNSSGAVSWPSKLQQTLATSTVEAKTNATSECVKETIHFRGLLAFLAYNQPSATTIWSDNQASIAISGNASFCKSRTKRFAVKVAFKQEVQTRNKGMLKYVPSESSSSDILTKSLGKSKTESFEGDLLGTNSSFNLKRQA